EAEAFDATGGGAAVGGERSLGERAAATGEEGRRPGRGASGAGAGVEPAPAGKRAHQNAEAGAGKVPRLRAHAGLRVPGQEPPSGGEQGDAAAVADRGGAAAGEAAEGGGGARVATATELARGGADEAVEEGRGQIGRAWREMEIGWIAAHSPQAKGRIERFFGTAQDRLVKGLRLAQAASLEEANTYLEQEYLPLWNRSFTVVA